MLGRPGYVVARMEQRYFVPLIQRFRTEEEQPVMHCSSTAFSDSLPRTGGTKKWVCATDYITMSDSR